MREAARPPTLTAVRRRGTGRVGLEVDGRPWRVVPDEVVVRCGLAAGVELDRPLLRRLSRELRRSEALDAAVRTVARRDVAAERLRQRLAARGVRPASANVAISALKSAGVVNDARLAAARARSLAERGWGDAAIVFRLEQEGIPGTVVGAAVSGLEPETARATALAARAREPRQAWRLLARRGFAPETIEEAVGALDEER